MSIFRKNSKNQSVGKNLRSGVAKVATAVTSKASRVFQQQKPVDKSKRNWDPKPIRKKGKPVTEMSDEEFERFTARMTDEQYWELQAQRGIYQPDQEIDEDYEDE